MKVENMKNPKTGRDVPSQFRIMDDKGSIFFQSHDTIIAVIHTNEIIQLDREKWNYSRTASKYRNQFLCETTKETQAKIDSGEYILTDLN